MGTIPRITLISHYDHQENEAPVQWVTAQENPQVDVILFQGPVRNIAQTLSQLLPHVKSDLFCWLEPGSEIPHPQWLDYLLNVWQDANVDLLGIRGLAEIKENSLQSLHKKNAMQVGRVRVGGHSGAVESTLPQVTSVLALGPGMLMGRVRSMLPWVSGLGNVLKPTNLVTFTLQCGMFAGLRLGVVENFSLLDHVSAGSAPDPKQIGAVAAFMPLTRDGVNVWHKNLTALAEVQPELIAWLAQYSALTQWTRIQMRGDGRLLMRGGSLDAIVSDVYINTSDASSWWVLGGGTGKAIKEALSNPDISMHVLEPDAALLCHVLSRHDFSQALLERRLNFYGWDFNHPIWHQVGARQLLAHFQRDLEASSRPVQFITGGSFHLSNSVLKEIERALHRMWLRLREVMHWKEVRQQVFDVTVVSPQCVIFKDLAECFHRMGFKTRLLNVSDGSVPITWAKDSQHALNLVKNSSALTVFRNRSLLESDNWLEPMPISAHNEDAWVSWWWDLPNIASQMDQKVPSQSAPAFGFAQDMLGCLPEGSNWLPPAARMQFCMLEPVPETQRHLVSFVGQSRWTLLRTQLAILRSLVPSYVPASESMCNTWRWQRSAIGLHEQLKQDEPWIHYAIERLALMDHAKAYYLEYVWNIVITGIFRMAAIEMLIREGIPVSVYGDDDWLASGIVPASRFFGVIQPEELTGLYRNSRVNLNLNFMQVSSTVNPKVLDISACNAVTLTDHRRELEVLFPDVTHRPASFGSLDELPNRVLHLLDQDTAVIGARAGEWVRSRHTMQHRAAWFAQRYQLRTRF